MESLFRILVILPIVLLNSCDGLGPIAEDVKEIANNDAITIKVDKDSFQWDTDVHIEVDVRNKDAPKIVPSGR